MSNQEQSLLTTLTLHGWPERIASDIALGAHVVEYRKRSTIFRAGEPADLVYFLLSGAVRVLYGVAPGSRILVGIAYPSELLGRITLAVESSENDPRQVFTAETHSSAKIAIVSLTRLSQTLHQLPPADLIQVLGRLGDDWAKLSCRLLALLSMSIRERLTYCIEEIAGRFGTAEAQGTLIGLRLSHEDLADLVGASRPIVSKHLKKLTHEGVLSRHGGRYLLRNDGAAGLSWPQAEPAPAQPTPI
jgi:CRP/FNR family transcriptional regulator